MPTKIPREEEQRQLKELEFEIQYHETVENMDENPRHHPISTIDPKIPKKRGPKKKQMTPSRVARFKVRRIKANGRERERMKDLNQQLERLRETIPCFALSQKLSKIETLRLAKNYIEALTQMISTNQIPDNTQFAQLLCKNLSPNTMNLVAATLSLNPRLLQQNDENYTMMTLDNTYMLSSIHPRVQNPLEFINLKKITTNLTSESEDHGSSYCGDSSSMDDISPMTVPEHSQSFPTNFYSHEQQFMHPDHSFYYYHHQTHY
jgi:neurogenic differentiation factor 1